MKSGVSSFIGRHKFEIAIVVLAVLVRLIYLGLSIEAFNGDIPSAIGGSDGYFIVSKNLIAGNGLSQELEPPYTPYSFRPPLYHFFIVGGYHVFGGFLGVIVFQILIGSLIPLIGMALTAYLVKHRAVQLIVGFILAIEPSAVLYSVMFYSEIFFMLLFFGSMWALFAYLENQKLSLIVLSSFLLGLATLTRPATQYVPLIIAAVLLWQARSFFSRTAWTAIGAYVAVFLLVLSPWVYRNWATFGVAGISPQMGVNLYTQLLPTVYSIDRGTPVQQEFNAIMATGARGPNLAYITDGKPYAEAAIPLLLERPKALLLSAMNSVWSFFVMDGMFDFLRHIKIRPGEMLGKPSTVALFTDPGSFISYFARNLYGPLAFILAARLVWIAITGLFLYGVWRYFRQYGAQPAALITLGIVLYTAATATLVGFGLVTRYRLPVNALILIFSVYGAYLLVPLVPRMLRRIFAKS